MKLSLAALYSLFYQDSIAIDQGFLKMVNQNVDDLEFTEISKTSEAN